MGHVRPHQPTRISKMRPAAVNATPSRACSERVYMDSAEQLQSRRTSQEIRQEKGRERKAEQPPAQHVEGRVIRRPESRDHRQNERKDQKNQRNHVLPPFKLSIRRTALAAQIIGPATTMSTRIATAESTTSSPVRFQIMPWPTRAAPAPPRPRQPISRGLCPNRSRNQAARP